MARPSGVSGAVLVALGAVEAGRPADHAGGQRVGCKGAARTDEARRNADRCGHAQRAFPPDASNWRRDMRKQIDIMNFLPEGPLLQAR